MRRTPVLVLYQCVQLAPGCKAAGLAVETVYRPCQRSLQVAALTRKGAKFNLQISGVLSNARAPVRETGEGVTQTLKFRVLVAEHARVMQRINRQLVGIVGPNSQTAGLWVETEHELSRFQHRPVLVAE